MTLRQYFKGVIGSVLLLSLVVGCATTGRNQTDIGLKDMQLNELKRHEYKVIDTVEGVGMTKTVLGFTFPLFSRQSGRTVANTGYSIPISLLRGHASSRLASGRAMYDALSKLPSADGVFTMSETTERRGLPFIFRVETATVKVRAIEIKSDEELDRGHHTGRSITITSEGDLVFDIED